MTCPYNKSTAGWREIGETRKYYRSLWEANYARWLQYQLDMKLIMDWKHEPETFWFPEIKRGVMSYLPDFRILRPDGSIYFAEVKGFMDPKSLTKLKRFKRFYPDHEIYIIDAAWFAANTQKLRIIIKDWETGESPTPKRRVMVKKKVYV